MCGIAGYTHLQRRAESGFIRKIAASLTHRGPDQQGIYESDKVSLAGVRLKIIDLEGGDQPVFDESGDSAIVFNGEIYNHAELRRELEGRGRRFRSRCDTEVVLQAFLEWDTAAFSRLRGMFAAAVWSKSRQRLVLARDRLGIKPLYVYRAGQDVYFGSELKAILAHRDVPRRLDLEGLNDYLSLNYVPGPRTLVEGIEKLPPGHWLEWHEGVVRMEPWWQLEFQPDPKLTLEAAREELDRLLGEAVREHLISDVPLGVWASGGLDSSTIVHYAAGARSLKTFSISFKGRGFDESQYFREIARIYGCDHHEFDINADLELASAIEELAWYSDEPSADAGALPVWFLSRMSRRHVTVALSGEGADELFGGYLTYLADDCAKALRLTPAAGRNLALRGLHRWWPVSDDKIGLEYKLKRLLEGSLLSPAAAHCYWNGTFSAEQKAAICPGIPSKPPSCAQSAESAACLNRFLLLDQTTYLPDDILYKVDRMSMAHSLEVRPPFLDHRIAEFAARLPENLKVRGFRTKFLLRDLMKDKLPASILKRRKTGLDIPAHEWFRGVLRPLLLDTLTHERLKSTGIFDADAVHRLIRSHQERRVNVGYHLWGLLTLILWMNRWGIQAANHPERPIATSSSLSSFPR
ncbi:MAG: asparagine synthase (glutamine-hydrolyzing) [Bryobacteraceae bacterium]